MPTLDLGKVVGPQGPQGAIGPVGPQGIQGPKGDDHVFYGTCSTAAATAAKTVSLTGFSLVTGAMVAVKFTSANTASSPTLNVNGTGAKAIKKYGTTAVDTNMWAAGTVVQFVYDGTNWVMENGTTATTTCYGTTKLSSEINSTSEGLAATSKAVKQAYDLAAGKQNKLTGVTGQAVGFDASGAAVPVRGWSNPNLLDNWYFARPVNQNGKEAYSDETYNIDRWYREGSTYGTVDIVSGGIRFTCAENRRYLIVSQTATDLELVGKEVTLSALTTAGELYFGTCKAEMGSSGWKRFLTPFGSIEFAYFSETLPQNFRIRVDTGKSVTIAAVKLELGSQQTLAVKDADGNWVLNDPQPDPTLELLKCCRYMIELISSLDTHYGPVGIGPAENSKTAKIFVPIPAPMHGKPTISFSGNIRLVDMGTTFNEPVTAITLDRISSNMVALNVKCAADIAAGKTYSLWAYGVPAAGEKNSIRLDANL